MKRTLLSLLSLCALSLYAQSDSLSTRSIDELVVEEVRQPLVRYNTLGKTYWIIETMESMPMADPLRNAKNYCIISLGTHPVGTKLSMRLTIANDQNATIIKQPYFYYYNPEVFQPDIDSLKDAQLQVEKFSDTYIKGTVTASEGEILFTSLPYQDGWTVKVDGKKVEHLEVMKAMIGVELTPGTHTVTFSYTPPGFVMGVVLFILGIGMLVLFYRYDKKNNKVLIAAARSKKLADIQAEKKA